MESMENAAIFHLLREGAGMIRRVAVQEDRKGDSVLHNLLNPELQICCFYRIPLIPLKLQLILSP